MLKKLDIRNLTIIDHLEMRFYPGFSVITGETGAGKSIIIGAIGLLLGNRADAKMVKKGKEKCIVEATFDLSIYHSDVLKDFFVRYDLDYEPAECLLRREVSVSGKSRAFINDTPVTLAVIRELGEQLIDIHSQHQNLLLNREDFQLNVVDIIAHDKPLLADYQKLYAEYRDAVSELDRLKSEIEHNRENEDFLRFQLKELSDANLKDGEQEQLEQTAETMTHAEDIKRVLHEADCSLSGDEAGVVNEVRLLASQLHNVEDVYTDAREFADRLDNCFIELKDISQEIASKIDDIEFDPKQLDEINVRLDMIYSLQQKYHVVSISDLLAKQTELEQQLENIDNGGERLEACERKVAHLRKDCEAKAEVLDAARRKAAVEVERDLAKLLAPLGIPNVRFKVDIINGELGPKGSDKAVFLFSANTNTEMLPVSQVASGGEIARVMLSLKAMISKAIGLPTIIFDEIDTGVSGRVAEQMAHIMRDMGDAHRQVICITHLPQIAAMADSHYLIEKTSDANSTISNIYPLSEEESVKELARMLGGVKITDAVLQNAREMRALAKQ